MHQSNTWCSETSEGQSLFLDAAVTASRRAELFSAPETKSPVNMSTVVGKIWRRARARRRLDRLTGAHKISRPASVAQSRPETIGDVTFLSPSAPQGPPMALCCPNTQRVQMPAHGQGRRVGECVCVGGGGSCHALFDDYFVKSVNPKSGNTASWLACHGAL